MIDPLTVVTNGILASNSNIIIVDPLGYFVIRIEEIIEEIPSGGGFVVPTEYTEPTPKYRKTIRLRVYSDEDKIRFEKTIELDNVELSVKSAKLENQMVKLQITNPKSNVQFSDYEIVVDVSEVVG